MPQKIQVHDKVLAHLSKGLYRSPASALRELVSNAWDANATKVRIDTNYPSFLQITIEDDGDGFDIESFSRHMSGNIGNSSKRDDGNINRKGRPLIGRLGIGLLGIAQICGGFTIASKPKQGKPFQAKVKLFDDLKEKLDDPNTELIEANSASKTFDIGTFEFEEVTIEIKETGTVVIADDVYPAFANTFQNSIHHENFQAPPRDWRECLKILSDVATLQELGDYWRLIWELSASCPIPYVSEDAVPGELVGEDQKKLLAYDFCLIIDNRQIFKPVCLHGNPEGYTTQTLNFQKDVYESTLKLHGYIAVQEGKQIKPDELRGILVRIKNIGIGYYDASLFDLRTNHGPRSRWITGEIYIEEGLENSLNVDRDSFNRFDPEYRTLQNYVHQVLAENVFKQVYKNIEKRSKIRKKQKDQKRHEALETALSEVVYNAADGESKSKAIRDTIFESSDKDVEKVRSSQRPLAKAILCIFDSVNDQKSSSKRREQFIRLIETFLKNW